MRPPTPREKWLLVLCVGTLFIMANAIGVQRVAAALMKSNSRVKQLKEELSEQKIWLAEGAGVDLEEWLDQAMPKLESTGKNQGEILQKLQTEAFERKLRMERQNLLEPVATEYYQEVSVNVIVRGELAKINEWLTTLQKPEDFYVVKNLEVALDTNSREKEPQARCNLTLARWFQPES